METIRAQITEEKARQYRKTAMQVFGYSKGSISKAVEKAMDAWVKRFEIKNEKEEVDWSNIEGALKELDIDAVELQHKSKELWLKSD